MMKFPKIGLLLLLVLPLHLLAAPNDVIATVNGKPIKQASLDLMVKQATANDQKVDDESKRAMTEILINREILAQEAEKSGIDKRPDFSTRMDMLRQQMLATTYLQENVKKAPTDDATLKAEYEKLKQAIGNKEYNVRQILVASDEDAKSIISQLSKGADFAKIAKEKSIDEATKDNGGSIGWVIPAIMRRPFSTIITGLPKGLYTTVPVQTQAGWVILKVDDVRDKEPPTYDKVKDQIAQRMQQEQADKMVSDLRAKAKVVNNLPTSSSSKK